MRSSFPKKEKDLFCLLQQPTTEEKFAHAAYLGRKNCFGSHSELKAVKMSIFSYQSHLVTCIFKTKTFVLVIKKINLWSFRAETLCLIVFSEKTNFILRGGGLLYTFIIYSMTNNLFKDIFLCKPRILDVAFVTEFKINWMRYRAALLNKGCGIP